MPANITVPIHVFFNVLPGLVVAVKHKAVHEFALLYGVKSPDISIFLRRGHMCELLPGSLLRSSYRYFYKSRRLYQFENIFLNFIKRELSSGNTGKDLMRAYAVLKQELLQLLKDPFGTRVFEYFDFTSRAERKI